MNRLCSNKAKQNDQNYMRIVVVLEVDICPEAVSF